MNYSFKLLCTIENDHSCTGPEYFQIVALGANMLAGYRVSVGHRDKAQSCRVPLLH